MKLRYYFRPGKAAFAIACAWLLTHVVASATLLSAGVDLGAAGRTQSWAVFSIGTGVTDEHHDEDGDKGKRHGDFEQEIKKLSKPHSGHEVTDELSGEAVVVGNVGVAGFGDITLSGKAEINGNLSIHTGGTLKKSGHAQILGKTYQNAATDSILKQGVSDAFAASKAAFAMSVSAGYPSTIHANKSLTLSGTGNVVLKLTDFELSGNAKLTLQGTAATSFIINVSHKFELSGGASVSLTGGLTWNNVLFNITGGDKASLSGESQLTGIILAPKSTVELSGHAQVLGEVIANKVVLSGGSSVRRPPIVSP